MAFQHSTDACPENLDLEELPFIEKSSESLWTATPQSRWLNGIARPRYVSKSISFLGVHPWLTHAILVFLYTGVFFICFGLRSNQRQCLPSSSVWSPAQDAIEWESRIIDAIPGSTPFTGFPNAKSDAAWTDLLQGINVRILPSEMERLGYTSLELADGSGYIGSLGVYHELHCLKRVRKMVYKDYYYPNMTTDEWHHRMGHVEHCLEQIRQSAICHGDVNVIPFTWLQDEEHQTASPSMQFGSRHQCVKWDKVEAWTKARRVDLFDEELLMPAEPSIQMDDTA